MGDRAPLRARDGGVAASKHRGMSRKRNRIESMKRIVAAVAVSPRRRISPMASSARAWTGRTRLNRARRMYGYTAARHWDSRPPRRSRRQTRGSVGGLDRIKLGSVSTLRDPSMPAKVERVHVVWVSPILDDAGTVIGARRSRGKSLNRNERAAALSRGSGAVWQGRSSI